MEWIDEAESAIDAFEKSNQMSITVHDRSGLLSTFLPTERMAHASACCRAVKAALGPEACLAFDSRRVHDELRRRPEARVQVCHAGFVEWVAPVVVDDELVAVIFAGQRNPRRLTRLRVDARPRRSSRRHAAGRPKLPTVTDDDADHHLELLRQLAARLTLWCTATRQRLGGGVTHDILRAPARRAAAIRGFILAHHTRRVTLADLADHLHLSASRASHAVIEATGENFQTLVGAARVRTASALLRHTDLPISDIARRCGLPNVAQFHRAFRRSFGQTPAQYRRSSV